MIEVTNEEKAREEFDSLRNDDPVFKEQWDERSFEEWFEDVFIPTGRI